MNMPPPVGFPGRLITQYRPCRRHPATARRRARKVPAPDGHPLSHAHGHVPTGDAMSTSAKTQSRQPTATRARTRTSARKGDRSTSLTSERIADDLAAFRKDGGKIEVLGNTQVFKSIGP